MFDDQPDDLDSAAGVVRDALWSGIEAGHPDTVLSESLSLDGSTLRVADEQYDLAAYEEVVVLGGGNGAGQMASVLADLLGPHLDGGVVVTDDPAPAGPIDVVEGTHPVPSTDNVAGTERLLDHASAADDSTLALVPITGGGSALLAAPAADISLSDLRSLTEDLLESGVAIDRLNSVRKHVSRVKGGQLAQTLASAETVGLVLSDVSSDDPSVVASGPLSPDPTTYDDARAVLADAGIDAPAAVADHLSAGQDGTIPDTPTAEAPAFESVTVKVLATGRTALDAAAETCGEAGYTPLVLSSSVRGEASEVAKVHVAIAEEIRRRDTPVAPPAAILSGGETTVTVSGDGVGGPNQEFALSGAAELPDGVVIGAVDTDGIDGPTDAAGALVTPDTVADSRAARQALAGNDAYSFLAERDALLHSGPTGTNLNDIRVIIVVTSSAP